MASATRTAFLLLVCLVCLFLLPPPAAAAYGQQQRAKRGSRRRKQKSRRKRRVTRAGGSDVGVEGLEGLAGLASLFGGLGDLGGDLGGGGGGGLQANGGNSKGVAGRNRRRRGLCPEGEHVVPKPLDDLLNEVPRRQLIANGCGPEGMEVKEPFGLWRCCNGHDVCYSTCGASFQHCESEFASCMKRVCAAHTETDAGKGARCQEQAQGFTGMTGIFGRGSHAGSQRSVCGCTADEHDAHKQWVDFIMSIYSKTGTHVDKSFVERLVHDRRGKEGELAFQLNQKFGPSFVKATGSVPLEFVDPQDSKLLDPPSLHSDDMYENEM